MLTSGVPGRLPPMLRIVKLRTSICALRVTALPQPHAHTRQYRAKEAFLDASLHPNWIIASSMEHSVSSDLV
jgi:hypothetical protein